MTSQNGASGATSVWVWVGIGAGVVLALILAVAVFGGGDSDGSTDTTSSTLATSTTEATSSTTVAAFLVPETPIVGVLAPYGDTSPLQGPTEAHWYQSDGLYVVLYRGFDASSGTEICAGNSIHFAGEWADTSNSPHLGAADAICVDTTLATPPSGVYACGSLLYYITEIPFESVGNLFGTLELGTADGFIGETSSAPSDAASTPEFVPGESAYQLPPSGVDGGGLVTCG